MDHQKPLGSASRPERTQYDRKPSSRERLKSVLQEDHQRMNGWTPSSVPEPYRPDQHVAQAGRNKMVGRRWERINDLYIALLYMAILGAFVTGIVNFLGSSVVEVEAPAIRSSLAIIQTESLLAGFSLVGASWLGRFATVLGPVAVDKAQATWWLTLPVSTGPYLRRRLIWQLVTATFLGFVGWLFIAWGALEASQQQLAGGFGGVLSAALSSGLLVLLVFAISALAQTWGWHLKLRKLWSLIPGVVLAVLAVEAIISASATLPPGLLPLWFVSPVGIFSLVQQGGVVSVTIPAVLTVVAGLVTWRTLTRIERIPHADLIRAGESSAHLSGVLTLLESRHVNTAVLGRKDHPTKRLTPKRRGGGPRHPAHVWAMASFWVLLRDPTTRRATLTSIVVVVFVILSEVGQSVTLLTFTISLSTVIAMRGLTSATDQIADQPGLQRLLPLGHQRAWIAHTIAPTAFLLPWGLIVGVVSGWAVHGPENPISWLLTVIVAVFSATALAASTVRTSTRPPVEWGSVLQTLQAGRLFTTVIRYLTHGIDTALLAGLPLVISLTLSHITPGYLVFALVTCLVAWCIAVHVSDKKDEL